MKNLETTNVLDEVLAIDLKAYMVSNNFLPQSEQRNMVFFNSPFQTSQQPMSNDFIVNKMENTWYCLHTEQHGNIIDLDALLHRRSISESVEHLRHLNLEKHKTYMPTLTPAAQDTMPIKVLKEEKISDENIIRFLKDQRLPLLLASKLFNQSTFLLQGHLHTGLGIKTATDRPYIYVPDFGACYLKSDYKLFDFQSDKVSVFTNVLDMMHNIKMTERSGSLNNMLLLTDIYAFEQARPVMERHLQINLYFPKESTARHYIGYAQWLSPSYKDFTESYGAHTSLSKARLAEKEKTVSKKNQKNHGR